MKKLITGEIKSNENLQSYLDRIEDEQQLEAIRFLNENPNESFLYSLYKKLKASQ